MVVNDASGGFTSPELIAHFAGFQGKVWRSNNLNTLSIDHCATQPSTLWHKHGDMLRIVSRLLPACGLYAFDGVPLDVVRDTRTGLYPIASGLTLRVDQPRLLALPPSGLPALYGTMTVDVSGTAPMPQILLPDLHSLSYRSLPEQ